jgi:hypothetical protein
LTTVVPSSPAETHDQWRIDLDVRGHMLLGAFEGRFRTVPMRLERVQPVLEHFTVRPSSDEPVQAFELGV